MHGDLLHVLRDAASLCFGKAQRELFHAFIVPLIDAFERPTVNQSRDSSSGCGKTTILRMVAGFELPGAGSIQLDSEEITRRAANKRPMGMVFQSYALFPHMTAEQNIALGMRIKKQPVVAGEPEYHPGSAGERTFSILRGHASQRKTV